MDISKLITPGGIIKSGREIERKFLIKGFPEISPELQLLEESSGYQIYLCTEPIECRLHAKDTTAYKKYTNTLKTIDDIDRLEVESLIEEETFNELVRNIDQPGIKKECRRYLMADGHVLDVCKVDDSWFYAEIEFATIALANEYNAPEWLGEEVTHDPKYKMGNYWKRTRGVYNEVNKI